jgi:hypothetical protein
MRRYRGILMVAVLAVIGACSDDDGDDSVEAEVTTTTAAPTTTTSLPPISTPPEPTTDLADGRHPVHITTVAAADRKLTVDVIQFLTGDAAARAAAEDGEESPPPNDYYVRNVNPRLRTLPVAVDAPVTLNALLVEETRDGTDRSVTFDRLASFAPERLRVAIVWITLEGGTITAIEEQFVP